MSELEALGWRAHATKEGVYIRPMEGIESLVSLLVSVGSSPVLSSVVSVKTSISDLEAVLKRAWVKLRNLNPSLATFAYREDGQGYLCYNANDTKDWLEETFIVHQHMTYEEMYCNTSPFKRTQLHWFQHHDHQEFYIRSIHENIDGIGIIQLTNQFLEFVAGSQTEQPPEKDVLLNLAPCLRIAAEIGPEDYAEEGKKLFDDFVAGSEQNAVSMPAKRAPSGPARPGRVDVSISKSVTTSLLRACKSYGITISHAYCAAQVLSVMKLYPPKDGHRIYPCALSINIRDSLPAPYRGSRRPTALYNTNQYMLIPMPEHSENLKEVFLPLARVFKDKYIQAREDPKLIAMQKAQMEMLVEVMAGSQDTTPDTVPGVSSLGNLDNTLKTKYDENLVVEDFSYGVQMRGSTQTPIWTYQGKLNMAFFFDHGDFEEADLKELMVDTENTLLIGLGVQDK